MSVKTLHEPVYALVLFEDEGSEIMDVHLIPYEWLWQSDGKWMCQYLPLEKYNKRNGYLEILKDPESHWEQYDLQVLATAHDLTEAREHFNKVFAHGYIVRPDDEEGHGTSQSNIEKTTPGVITSSWVDFMAARDSKETQSEHIVPPMHVEEKKDDASIRVESIFNEETIIELKLFITNELESMEKSLHHDLTRRIGEVKNAMVGMTHSYSPYVISSRKSKTLNIVLPLQIQTTFDEFEQTLGSDVDQKDALIHLYCTLLTVEKNKMHCIAKLMRATVNNRIELNYSCGNCGPKNKMNFSSTHTFFCIEGVMKEKFQSESINVKSLMGTWLRGASNRKRWYAQ